MYDSPIVDGYGYLFNIFGFINYPNGKHINLIHIWIIMRFGWVPSGKRLHNYGKSPFSMGKSTISMAIFNSKLLNYQRVITLGISQLLFTHNKKCLSLALRDVNR
jgi:hypothetical protein